MASGPHQISMGKRDSVQMPTAVRRLCGQAVMGPSGVADESVARIRSPIWPTVGGTRAERSSIERGSVTAAYGDEVWKSVESHRSDLNRRPLDYESSALPLSYCGGNVAGAHA